ncbi:tripartite tricarboxylate transporter substrate-binding protein [Gudongella sp. SC589]|jgi:tripartite-type tricarboxylate transporter receptor subunit TctC|uniref:tripartite tricarboxylate transporter substrate-binding protein n=1 Tax=Gudongella sp. SC589 TaxID=3385990 RepID=UPI003904B261
MLKLRKISMLLVLIALLVGTLSGCAGSDDPAPAPEQPATEAPASEALASDYPEETITWNISRDPGDGQDLIARGIARFLPDVLGVPVAVNNVPGAGGRVGYGELHRSVPDGYTIGQDVVGTMANFNALGELDFPLDDIEWFCSIYKSPAALWVSADGDIQSIQDLIDFDGEVLIGDSSMAGTQVPWTIALLERLGVEYSYVLGFEGTPPINMAIMRGEVDMVARSVGGQASMIGDLNAIVVMGEKRHPLLPDTPTLAEVAADVGQPELNEILPLGMTLYMVGAPPGTPDHITDTLEEGIAAVFENQEFLTWAEDSNIDADFQGKAEINETLTTVMRLLDEIGIVDKVNQ